MKSQPVVPARIDFSGGTPYAPEFADVYHPRAGALAQAQHVFLRGNGLPQRWQGRDRFVVLETGFGLGNNFLGTWAAWRDDPRRCDRLWFVSIDKHPPTLADLARAHEGSAEAALAQALQDAWPPLTPNLHTLAFDGGRVTLLLALGDAAQWLPEIVARVDAFYLDGFAPERNPAMWDARLFKGLGRLAAPGATAATWSVARSVRDGLRRAGFIVERAPGFGDKREMTVARFEPRFMPRPPPGRVPPTAGRDALVIGAGLAGAATAQALARVGFACRVLDAAPGPAQGASGNAAGLFHGTVHANDGPHARFIRAGALEAARTLRPLVEAGRVPGQVQGLLRIEAALSIDAMRARRDALGLPPGWVQALDAPASAALAGWPLAGPAWFYPGGGWIDPAALVRHWLADPAIDLACGLPVEALRRHAGRWQALDAAGRVLAEADVVVLAAALDTARLAGDAAWPLEAARGQVTRVPPGVVPSPKVPIAGAGYAIPLPGGAVLCGATSRAGDGQPDLLEADHLHNLERLAGLANLPPVAAPLDGRVGWRLTAQDRLPLVGAMQAAPGGARHDQPRLMPREPGLFVHAALGSRGLTWAALNAQSLAAAIAGVPSPLESSLLDAIDPARFDARAVRRSAS